MPFCASLFSIYNQGIFIFLKIVVSLHAVCYRLCVEWPTALIGLRRWMRCVEWSMTLVGLRRCNVKHKTHAVPNNVKHKTPQA